MRSDVGNLGFSMLMVPTASASTQATLGCLVELTFLWWSVHIWTTVDEMFEQLIMAIKRTMRGGDGGGSVDEKVSGGAAPSGSFQEKKAPYPLSINRSSDPCNEFENNGMHTVEMFRGTYPRRRFESFPGNEVTGAAADPGAKKLWFPLSANGSLSLVQTRHLLLQFTNVAAHDVAPDFAPENQLHRQSMLRAVREGVTQESFVSIKSIGTTSSHDPPPLKKTFPNCPREPLTLSPPLWS